MCVFPKRLDKRTLPPKNGGKGYKSDIGVLRNRRGANSLLSSQFFVFSFVKWESLALDLFWVFFEHFYFSAYQY